MKLIEKLIISAKKQPINSQSVKHWLRSHTLTFPNTHIAAIGSVCLLIGMGSLISSDEAVGSARSSIQIELPPLETNPDISHMPLAKAHQLMPSSDTVPKPEPVAEPKPSYREVALKVKPNDNLSRLFKRAGLSDREMMNFLGATDKPKSLNNMKPGHELVFRFDTENNIAELDYVKSKLKRYRYAESEGRYYFEEVVRTADIKTAYRSGEINSSLYKAGMNSGLDDKLIMELAEIFGWDIDFALDIRKGDQFKILYEEHFLDGEKLKNGAILSAEFTNQSDTFKAVRYLHENGRAEYYTPEGKNMRKAFLRAPVDFRRISSGFNPKRLHPVTKTVRPHRGIDYAAKTGTPVWSSGDGRVIASAYGKANGNYVIIQHGNNIQTKYLHLHKRKVKKGDKVRQKQIIGTVGSTGMSTGPHLHYEFLLAGVHRNPRTILNKLPKAEAISSKLKEDFQRKTKPYLAELKDNERASQLVLNKHAEPATL